MLGTHHIYRQSFKKELWGKCMLGWTIFVMTKFIFFSDIHCNHYMLLYVLGFINRVTFLDYRFKYVHVSIDC